MEKLLLFLYGFWEVIKIALGAFFGAWCAFKYQKTTLETTKKEKELADIKLCQVLLYRQYNSVLLVKTDSLDQHKNNDKRYMKILPSPQMSPSDRIDLNRIGFLAGYGKVELLADIGMAQDKYLGFLEAWNNRNKYHLKVQEWSDGKTDRTKPPEREILYVKQCTDATYAIIDTYIPFFHKMWNEINKVIPELYPGKGGCKIEI